MPTLPLFPLGTVLYPGVVLPLHVFEPRYRQLVTELRKLPAGPDRRFGVVALRQGGEVGEDQVVGITDLHELGCAAQVRRIDDRSDGGYQMVVVGTDRFRLDTLVPVDTPYLTGEVSFLPDPLGDEARAAGRAGAVLESYREYLALIAAKRGGEAVLPELPADPRTLSYLVAATALLDLTERQQLLASPDAAHRLGIELGLLRREIGLVQQIRAVPVTASELGVSPSSN